MSRFYPDKPDSHQDTAWNFLMDRRVRTKANQQAASLRRVRASLREIEALLKKEKAR